MNYVLFDLACLRFERVVEKGLLVARAETGDMLGIADATLLYREAVAEALDDALVRGYVRRGDGTGAVLRCKVALYNPHTAQLILHVGDTPATLAAHEPLHLPPEGFQFSLTDDEMLLSELTLTVAGVTCKTFEPSWAALSRSHLAHLL